MKRTFLTLALAFTCVAGVTGTSHAQDNTHKSKITEYVVEPVPETVKRIKDKYQIVKATPLGKARGAQKKAKSLGRATVQKNNLLKVTPAKR